jgi:arylsulfatase B
MKRFVPALLFLVFTAFALVAPAGAARPNIVFVMTDDQGYGDLGFTGNPVVKTPHLDRLAAESSQLTDYHVAPTCSPTRAALMTGRWNNRTGVWHTVNGRSMLREDETTFVQVLREHGYATGLFGKWHLGDNFPFRPEDRGFTETYWHRGGGVGQTPDHWNNAYFDGHYTHNGRVVPAQGFCTDVFFEQAGRFVRDASARGQPFFAYIAPNAPHNPLHAPQAYLDAYKDQTPDVATFFAMITHLDERVGRFRALLAELGVADNTLFIFTTDNGTAYGQRVFNAGMRGNKGSEYDGGHRVPFLLHWPARGLNRQHIDDTLTHVVDVFPTLLEAAGLAAPPDLALDGRSLLPLLDPALDRPWPDRMTIADSQRVRDPVKWKNSAVMSQRWRLINGRELYSIKDDPGQTRDVAADHPEAVAAMRAFYESWWSELEPTFARETEIPLGHPDHPTVSLNAHDWIQETIPPWNQMQIREARGVVREPEATTRHRHSGHWAVRVEREGVYEIVLRRWPAEAQAPIAAGLPAEPNVPGSWQAYRARPGVPLPITTAALVIDGETRETKPVAPSDLSITFVTRLAAGSHRLAPIFATATGDEVGAYYADVRWRGDSL